MSGASCCEVGAKDCGCPVSGQQTGCPVSGAGSGCGCPVSGHQQGCADTFANAADVWLKDTVEAIRQVKLEILREKVRKEIGPVLTKAADAAWQAGGAQFQAMLAQSSAAQAKEKLAEEIRKIFSEKK